MKQLDGHWAQNEIGQLIKDGIVKGDGGELNLEKPVTRAEFAAMLSRTLDIESKNYAGGMSDVSADDWYADVLQACADKNIMNGNAGAFRPNDFITREEMAKMIVRAYGKDTDASDKVTFADDEKISEWAKEYVADAVNLGLMNGFEDESFRPNETALREQAMVVLARLKNMIK